MNIELTRASNSPGMSPIPATRPPGESSAPAQQAQRARAGSESQSLTEPPRNNEQAAANEQQVADAVEKLSKFVSNIRPEISFSVDESSGTRVVKIIDRQSKEVVRQIPSEEAIQLAQALDKLQGLFVRDTA